MTNVHTLYKVPIWIEDNIVSLDVLNKLEEACKYLSTNIPDYHHKYNPNTYKLSRNTKVHVKDRSEFAEINQMILEKAKLYMHDIGYSQNQSRRLLLDNAWFCMYRPGDCVQMHIHRPSFITAAFYIRNDTACKLRFIHDIYKMSYYPDDINNEWSKNSSDIDCLPGRLLIFNSDCAHGTDQIEKMHYRSTDVVKVMLSYNFLLEVK